MSLEDLIALVVDDEAAMREVLRQRLTRWGMRVLLAEDGATARSQLEGADVDLVLADVMLPDASGVELLRELRSLEEDLPVVMITAHGSVDLAVEAMKEGAEDFLTKPLNYEHLKDVLEEVERHRGQRRTARRLSSELEEDQARFGELVGASEAMKEVYELIRQAAPTDAPVLITGESGTGKELTARTLHDHSRRSGEEFLAVNTAAIPRELMESEIFGHEKGAFTGAKGMRKGCFELAHRGTLFLDEIAEMPLELQPKLLRVLEDGKVRRVGGTKELSFDVRLLSATNRDAEEAVRQGLLREDLLYRLNVFHIHLPALRERPDDVPLLVQHLLDQFNRKHGTGVEGLDDDARELLGSYDWPGNVRELRNLVERAVVVAKEGWIEPTHLPPTLRRRDGAGAAGSAAEAAGAGGETGGVSDSESGGGTDGATEVDGSGVGEKEAIRLPVGTSVEEAEKRLILRTLEATDNNKAEAARRLGIDVKTVRNKLKRWGITVKSR